ncbi:type II toxin-antitoxin system VapC family toxin [Mesorhizobium sp. SB112]|uniref:type II toxin-antitoxin system VapC family toxin n=1 Tax=Mesorhizobium sp. SB112 TaxID=3151853 RepID=UPI0032659926
MTAYLIDENVLREFGARGNANVRKWLATVDDADLRLSVATLFEKRCGAEMLKRRDPDRAAVLFKAITVLEKTFTDRILPVDAAVVEEWTRMLGAKNKDRWDMVLAATARIYGLVQRRVFVDRLVNVVSTTAILPKSPMWQAPYSGARQAFVVRDRVP